VLVAAGLRPWNDQATFYSLVAFSLGAGVVTAISSEFLRGASVIRKHTGQNLFASMIQLTRRNTRRYGGYLVHFGVVVIFIGIAGGAFKQNHEQEMNDGQSMTIGPYRIVEASFSEDSNPNYDTEFALLDVYRGNKKITQLAPEKRFYAASQQPETRVANHSTLAWDLYVIYAGKNPDSGLPIIKAYLNPLMAWIWIGVMIVAIGTLVALAPNLSAALASSRTRDPGEAAKPLAPQLLDEQEVAVAGRGHD
jgi:cytochrome c-type biogenesis protein CcmF